MNENIRILGAWFIILIIIIVIATAADIPCLAGIALFILIVDGGYLLLMLGAALFDQLIDKVNRR
jgi:hypothetical protein